MLFAIDRKNTALSAEDEVSLPTVICVFAICLIASTPLLVSFALMAFAS
jgi:hypothetical protein